MTWKLIKFAPKDGRPLILGHVDYDFVEHNARWGIHKQSGEERWVDAYGNGLFDATHFDYEHPRPKAKFKIGGVEVGPASPNWSDHDANGDLIRYDKRGFAIGR
jgi:hypothetical protein